MTSRLGTGKPLTIFYSVSLREEPTQFCLNPCKAAGKSIFASLTGLSFLFFVSTPPVDNFGKLPAPGAQTVLVARRDMAAKRRVRQINRTAA
jgi:hypothetical protein